MLSNSNTLLLRSEGVRAPHHIFRIREHINALLHLGFEQKSDVLKESHLESASMHAKRKNLGAALVVCSVRYYWCKTSLRPISTARRFARDLGLVSFLDGAYTDMIAMRV